MKLLLTETRREIRWATNSRLTLFAIAIALAFTTWSAYTDVANSRSATEQFRQTAANFASAGQSVEDALSAPLNVTSNESGQSNIDNPVRFDFENAISAASVLNPAGAIATSLSFALFFFLPVAMYAIGLFAATTDLRNGAIVFRWPEVRRARIFVGAKTLLLAAVTLVISSTLVFGSLLAGLVTSGMSPLHMGLTSFATAPSLLGGVVLYGVAFVVGISYASFGLFVGSLTRERAFSLTVFTLAYFLLPLFGTWDPRNLIPSAAREWLAFHGTFQPQSLGDISPVESVLLLSGATVVLMASTVLIWTVRDRTPASA